MGTIKIGNITVSGNDIDIVGGKIYVDGKLLSGDTGVKNGIVEVRIVEGTVTNIKSDANVTARDVGGRIDAGGNVTCENVKGDASAGGNMTCDNVGGDVSAGGNVNCGRIGGDLSAGGNVRHA